jgi:hypothetical protein
MAFAGDAGLRSCEKIDSQAQSIAQRRKVAALRNANKEAPPDVPFRLGALA